MLSKLYASSAFAQTSTSRLLARYAPIALSRTSSATPSKTGAPASIQGDSAERDIVNFPRPVRRVCPGKVRCGLVPDEWFTFFYNKTGVTGPYAFGVGLVTYLFSKEIYVMEHEFYLGLSVAILCVFAVKKLGPGIAKYVDKEIDQYEHGWKESREVQIRSYEEAVCDEKVEQWRAESQPMLFQGKRYNVALQLEAEYRQRLMIVYHDVKRILDYQVACMKVERRISHKHMVKWIIDNVMKSITPQLQEEALQKCIEDLRGFAKA